MNKSKIAICTLLLALCAHNARAGILVDFYGGVQGGMGAMFTNSQSYSSESYGAMFGIDIPIVRIEAEYNYLHSARNNNDMNLHVGMLNGYLKLLPTPIIKPYIGAGIGQIFGGNATQFDIDSTVAYQGMIGLQIDIPATPLFIDVETRAMFASDIAPGIDLAQWDGRVKLRYQF